MKKLLKFIPVLLMIPVLIVASCPVAFASTAYFQVDFNQPQLTGDDFYVEVLLHNPSTNDYRIKVIYFKSNLLYSIDNSFAESVFNTGHLNVRLQLNADFLGIWSVDNGGEKFGCFISEWLDDNSVNYYIYGAQDEGDGPITQIIHTDYGSGYSAVCYRVYGDVYQVGTTNFSNKDIDFSIVYSQANSTNQSILQVLNALSVLAQYDKSIFETLEAALPELGEIVSGLNNIDTSIDDYRGEFQKYWNSMISWLRNILIGVETLVDQTDQVEDLLDDIYSILEDIYFSVGNIEMWMPDIAQLLGELDTKLNRLIQIMSVKTDIPSEKLTQPDNSDMDKYYELENGLLNGDSDSVSDVVNVEVNKNALSTIFNLVDRALNLHPKVFGLIITILSLGIIALILGR